jgi:predicted Zn-dependent peptidase
VKSLLPIGMVLLAGCTHASEPPKKPPVLAAPVKPAVAPSPAATQNREPPPASGPAKVFRFPRVQSHELSSGLKIATIGSGTTPIVHIRMVVFGGSAADGTRPGLAALTAELIKEGGAGGMKARELVARIESLGATLRIDTGSDHTTIEITCTKEQLEEALRLLAAMAERPMFDAVAFGKVKKRAADRAGEQARASGPWASSMVLFRDLFDLPADQHPYATWDATAAELSAITLADCRDHHRRTFVAKNSLVVVTGEIQHADVTAAAGKAFSNYRGAEPQSISFTDPVPPESLKITLIDRPKSPESELVIGMLGPARSENDFPSFVVASEVLARALSGRAGADSKEAPSAVPGAGTRLVELAHGPSMLMAYASVRTESTEPAVRALFDHLKRLENTAPSDGEVVLASRLFVDAFAVRMANAGDLADELVRLRVLHLPDDHHDPFRKHILDVTPGSIAKTAGEYVRSDHAMLVVVGDASAVGSGLSRFGQVKVVDATKGFARIRTIAMN